MHIKIIPTNEYYHRLLEAPGAEARQQIFIDRFITPWAHMMAMVAPPATNEPPDPLAGARAWAWLLPKQTSQIASLLAQYEAAQAWFVAQEALTTAANSFSPYAAQIPFDDVTAWLVLADPARANPFERGYTGATDWTQPQLIGQFWEASEAILSRLPGLLAHELHHLVRLRLFPWDMFKTSVADYIVLEGLAESFAAELFGKEVVGYYVTEVDSQALAQARELIASGLDKTGFNVIRGYIFGDILAEQHGAQSAGGMPTYGGYAVGYHLVQAFLQRRGLSVAEATFLPAAEIVSGSGYFS